MHTCSYHVLSNEAEERRERKGQFIGA